MQNSAWRPIEEPEHEILPWEEVFSRIETGAIENRDGMHADLVGWRQGQSPMLNPSPTPRDASDNELVQIQFVATNSGSFMPISMSWGYTFYFYHSPSRGLLFVYHSRSGYGYYRATLADVQMVLAPPHRR